MEWKGEAKVTHFTFSLYFRRILLKSARRKTLRMNTLLSTIFKFFTTNQLYNKTFSAVLPIKFIKKYLKFLYDAKR